MTHEQIFNTFDKFSDLVQKRDRIRKLHEKNYSMQNTCGSCTKWMLRSQCAMETFKKVTCNDMICSGFNMNPNIQSLIDKNNLEIQTLSL